MSRKRYDPAEFPIHDEHGAPDWDNRFMRIALEMGQWSKDRSMGVGCVIVGPNHEIRSSGYNGFPRGLDDDIEARHLRPLKYKWTEHAERNAIFNAARIGVSIAGCRIYVPWFPCVDCTRAILQTGLIELIAFRPDIADSTWGEDFRISQEMLDEAKVEVRLLR